MSKVFNSNKTKEMEFTVSKDMDDSRSATYPGKDMAYVKLNLSVTGNSKGQIKTAGANGFRATGGSFAIGFGSDYCVADTTIPFTWEYARENQTVIMGIIGDIQNKFSVMLTKIQGDLGADVEKSLRDTAKRSRAIREAKEILSEDDTLSFDKAVFQRANRDIRAGVISDMSISAGVRSSFSIEMGSDKEEWAKSKGYTKVSGKSMYAIGADEKGLKKAYLIDAQMVADATDRVYGIGAAIQDKVSALLKSKEWSNDLALEILKEINNCISEDPNGPVKNITEFTNDEEAEIKEWRDHIVFLYRRFAEE